jgi:hypothetical protein
MLSEPMVRFDIREDRFDIVTPFLSVPYPIEHVKCFLFERF